MGATGPIAPGGGTSPDRWAVALGYVQGKKRAEESLGFLAACGEALSRTLDHAASLPEVAALCVPFLGDWCRIAARSDSGAPDVVAVRGSGRIAAEREPGFAEVLLGDREETRTPVAYSDAEGVPGRCDPAALARVREAGMSSALTMPIMARGTPLGTFALARTGDRDRVGPATVALAAELCRRLAAAVELASLHRRMETMSRAEEPGLAREALHT